MKKKVEIIKTRANKIAVGIFLLFISTLYCPKQLFASEFIEVQQQQDPASIGGNRNPALYLVGGCNDATS